LRLGATVYSMATSAPISSDSMSLEKVARSIALPLMEVMRSPRQMEGEVYPSPARGPGRTEAQTGPLGEARRLSPR
jgi:hypothetical protein